MGMLIIVIPMAIVLASFFEKNRFLQFLSMLCSYSGILFSLAHTTGRNLLEERMKTTLYTVFNTQNFVEKSELFRNAFNQRFNEANIIDKDFNSYIEKTSKINWDLYMAKVKEISTDQVTTYANTKAGELISNWASIKASTGSTVGPTTIQVITNGNHWYDSLFNLVFQIASVKGITALGALGLFGWIGYKMIEGSGLLKR